MAALDDHFAKSISQLDVAKEVANSDLILITQQTSSGTNRSKAISVRDFLATALSDYNDIKEWVESKLSSLDLEGNLGLSDFIRVEDGTGGGSGWDGDGDDSGSSSGNGGNSIWNGTAISDSTLTCNVSSVEDGSGRTVRVGDLYLNRTNQCIYACILVKDGVSTWELVTSIKGDTGAQGPKGSNGTSISWSDVSNDVQNMVTAWLNTHYSGGGSSGGSGNGLIKIVGTDASNSAEVSCLTINSMNNSKISAYVSNINATTKSATLNLGAYYK